MAKDITELLDEALERVTSPFMVVELSQEGVTDYERGRVSGRIEAIKWLMNELATSEAEDIETDTIK